MQLSLAVLSVLGTAVVAYPTDYPSLNTQSSMPNKYDYISEYFNLLAEKAQEARALSIAPTCDLSKAILPPGAAQLPPPGATYTLKHIALGRGTQNYTCDLSNSTAVPQAAGAVATLFDASCAAALHPDAAHLLSKVALAFDLARPPTDPSPIEHGSGGSARLMPGNLSPSGVHYFNAAGVPFFDLDVPGGLAIGRLPCAKNGSVAAPPESAKGPGGEAAVPWLKLTAKDGATGELAEVYRVETGGGSAPKTCAGMPAKFEIQYTAQYWFYAGPKPAPA